MCCRCCDGFPDNLFVYENRAYLYCKKCKALLPDSVNGGSLRITIEKDKCCFCNSNKECYYVIACGKLACITCLPTYLNKHKLKEDTKQFKCICGENHETKEIYSILSASTNLDEAKAAKDYTTLLVSLRKSSKKN
jgi:hypothetical protein